MKNRAAVAGPRRAFSYIRFSHPSQALGDSERRQLEAAQRYCGVNGLKLVDTYADKGVSAFHGKHRENGALGRLLKHVRPGDTIVIEDTDRWSREDPLDALIKLREQVQRGIDIVFMRTGTKVTKDNFQELQVIVPNFFGALLGNQENTKKSERVAEAWAKKRKSGERLTTTGPVWLQPVGNNGWEPIDARVKIIRDIFELGRKGLRSQKICRILNDPKSPVPVMTKAKLWHITTVAKLLTDRRLIGEFTPCTRRDGGKQPLDPIPKYFPVVIPPSLFASVQQFRSTRVSMAGRCSIRNPFAKLMVDRQGNTMSYVRKTNGVSGKEYEYLVAYGADCGAAPYANWPLKDFKEQFLALCHRAALAKAPGVQLAEDKVALARMELVACEKIIKRLIDFLKRGEMLKTVRAELTAEEERCETLRRQLADAESEAQARPVRVNDVNWKNTEALRANLLATVKLITVDVRKRWFKAEFLDGRSYEFIQTKDKVVLIGPSGEVKEIERKAGLRRS